MRLRCHPVRSVVTTLALVAAPLGAAPLVTQSGGFAAGELLLYSPAIQGPSSHDGALLRIDPLTGQASVLVDLLQSLHYDGPLAYDPFRDRVIFCGGFTSPTGQARVYLLDGFGATHDLGLGARTLYGFSPAQQGRIYYFDQQTLAAAPIKYLDASNVEHTLNDATGAAPFLLGPAMYQSMIFDAPTNSLLTATSNSAMQACAGGVWFAVNVRKLPLSADGSRVVGPVGCAQFTVDSGGGSWPVGLSRAPAGQVLLVVDTNSNATQPRMLSIDPSTLSIAPFASNGHAFAAATNAGCFSSARGEAVILDTGNDVLRAFAQGASGAGTVIATSIPVSSSGSSGEAATLVEVDGAACGLNNVSTYCTAKVTSGGCTPWITTLGGPSLSTSSGFVISAQQLEPQKPGLFFYGLSGPAAAPFQGGYLCVQPPTRRTTLQSSGGAAACSGAVHFDWNAWIASGADPFVGVGSNVHGQFWFRDPASPSTTGLSGGVEFSVCP
jgi:hypothetical protein